MSNMAYCRFENTLPDLQDCADALDNYGTADLSESERRAANQLIALCKRIALDYARKDD